MIGELPATSTFATGYVIHPFVATIPGGTAWQLSPREVDAVLELPLQAIREGRTTTRAGPGAGSPSRPTPTSSRSTSSGAPPPASSSTCSSACATADRRRRRSRSDERAPLGGLEADPRPDRPEDHHQRARAGPASCPPAATAPPGPRPAPAARPCGRSRTRSPAARRATIARPAPRTRGAGAPGQRHQRVEQGDPRQHQQHHAEIVEHLVGAERGDFLTAERGHAAVHPGRQLLQRCRCRTAAARLWRALAAKLAPSGVRLTAYQGRNTDDRQQHRAEGRHEQPIARAIVCHVALFGTNSSELERRRLLTADQQVFDRRSRLRAARAAVLARARPRARQRDHVSLTHPPRDLLPLGQSGGGGRAPAGLVDEPPHGGVDHLREKELKPPGVELQQLLLLAPRAGQQPAGDSDPVERPPQRRQPLGGTRPALGADPLDLLAVYPLSGW